MSEDSQSTVKPNNAVLAKKLAMGASAFIENRGQFDAQVKFQLKGGGKTLWLTNGGIVFDSIRPKAGDTQKTEGNLGLNANPSTPGFKSGVPGIEPGSFDRLVFSEGFIDANNAPSIEASRPQPGIYNYFTGNDPKKWRTNVRGYDEVVYRDVWKNIDLKLYRNGSDLEQEFIVKPGGDFTQVRVAFKGIDGLKVADDGSLVVSTAFGELRETKPRIYQEIDGKRVAVDGQFKLTSNTAYTFEVNGYHPQYALVIDPTLLYSTFLGGSGFEEGRGIAVDSAGNAYVTGRTTSTDFPTTPDAL